MKHEWKSIDIHPEIGKPLACISTIYDGSIKYTNFGDEEDGPYYYRPDKEVAEWQKPYHKGYFNNEGGCVSFGYWMYWDEFWEMLDELPKIEKEDEK